jgi:hypothetical protein
MSMSTEIQSSRGGVTVIVKNHHRRVRGKPASTGVLPVLIVTI